MTNMEQNLGVPSVKIPFIEKVRNSEETLEITNIMQIELAKKLYGKEDEEASMFQFATSDYSSRFRKIVEENPELIEEYIKNPHETLEIIKKKILH